MWGLFTRRRAPAHDGAPGSAAAAATGTASSISASTTAHASRSGHTCSVRFADERQPPLAVPRDTLLLNAALQAGLPWPHNCKVGTCGQCRTRVLQGRVRPTMDFALSPLSAQELREGWVLACQSRLREDLTVQVALDHSAAPAGPPVQRQAVVQQARCLVPGVLQLQLRLDAPLDFRAGQYVHLATETGALQRAYSLCEAPQAGGCEAVSFLIRRLPGGRFSSWLFGQARPGLRLQLHGPFGSATPALAGDAPLLGVAGGTGLAPMLSLMADRLARCPSARCTLLLGLRHQGDDFATPLLAPLHAAHPGRLQVHTRLSDEPADSAWPGPRGPVVDGLDAALLQRSGAQAAWLCGNAPMVQAARQRLLALGLPAAAIHADAFAPSGEAAAGQGAAPSGA